MNDVTWETYVYRMILKWILKKQNMNCEVEPNSELLQSFLELRGKFHH